MKFNRELMFSTGDNEHYTPVDLLFRVCDFYGGMIDLDVCSNSHEFPHTPACFHITKEIDGLNSDWFGNVFCNPPYSDLKSWSKAIVEKKDEYSQCLYLVPSRTDTQWYGMLTHLPRLNFRGRLKFWNPKNKGNSAPFPSVMFYSGPNPYKFRDAFQDMGEMILPKSFNKKEYQREYMKKRRAAKKKK